MIKLSIVTVTYNDLRALKRTFDSLSAFFDSCEQKLYVEHVIIDGCSNDGTVEYIKNIATSRGINTKYLSEPDKGIYDAMNKGVAESKGWFVVFLNAGDEIYNSLDVEALFLMLDKSRMNEDEAGVALSSVIKFANKKFTINSRSIQKNKPRLPAVHQSMIVKRNVLSCIPFDTSYKVCGDYDNFAKIYSNGMTFKPDSQIFSIFYAGGISSRSPLALFTESTRVTKKYFKLGLFRRLVVMALLAFALFRFQFLIFIFSTIDDK